MRCANVIEALAVSNRSTPDPAVAEHLAQCPRCAAWARNDARLTQLWEATRPEEPSPAVWANLWSAVTQALEAAPTQTSLASSSSFRFRSQASSRHWRRWVWGAVAVAQAAVILLAVWVVSRPRPGLELAMTPSQVVAEPGAASRAPIEINAEEIAFLQPDGAGGVKVVRRDVSDEGSSTVDFAYVLLNNFEAMGE
jgi:hypothetical protein